MQFLNPEVLKEYERLTLLHPDVPEYKRPLINCSDALRAYFSLADYFTDPSSESKEKMLIGLRSADLLYSALSRQCVSFCGKAKYNSPIDICSTLFFGMVKNHSFSDGNKRTALLTLLYQLYLYGYYPNCRVKDFERLVVAVASNSLSKSYRFYWKKAIKNCSDDCEVRTISLLLKKMTKKKDHSYHLQITTKDMVQALEQYGTICEVENGKLHFQRVIENNSPEVKKCNYTIVFHGWTRCVGAGVARDILTNLSLYDQFPNYQSFIDGQEPYYSLIQQFEGPLRRLKDE